MDGHYRSRIRCATRVNNQNYNLEKVGKLALGTAQFGQAYGIARKGNGPDKQAVRSILQLARSSGIDTLDTARAYGDSEVWLGEVGIEDWRVVSKLPAIMPEEGVASWVVSSVQTSLERLQVSRLTGMMVHAVAQLTRPGGQDLYKGLRNAKDLGLVDKIGVSVYTPDDLNLLASRFAFDIVQLPFNILDQRMAHSGWLSRLKDGGVEIHVRSVFLQGLLLMTMDELPDKFSPWRKWFEQWHRWLRAHNTSPVSACLGFVLANPDVDRLVLGVDSPDHMLEQLQATCCDVPAPELNLSVDDDRLINPSQWSLL